MKRASRLGAVAGCRARCRARRSHERLARRGDPRRRPRSTRRPGDHRHLAGRVRPQHARRQRRQGLGEEPGDRTALSPEVVRRGDFARVMAEFWADGPKSETPPGHWNTLANGVSDSPALRAPALRKGRALDPLAWDVHMYLALNGAEHDAAIAAWEHQAAARDGASNLARSLDGGEGPVVRSEGPRRTIPHGLPLVPGLIEVITKESSAPGQRHAHLALFVGQSRCETGSASPAIARTRSRGVGWVRAVDWITYQRRTFVTPAFPGFISGHSTFSRAGAEVLASLTGSPYFPGGLGEFVAPKDTFLTFEKGPAHRSAAAVGVLLRRLRRGRSVALLGEHPHSTRTTSPVAASAIRSASTPLRSRRSTSTGRRTYRCGTERRAGPRPAKARRVTAGRCYPSSLAA